MFVLLNCQVGVTIALASDGLTKLVTFTPYFMLINEAKVLLLPLVFSRLPRARFLTVLNSGEADYFLICALRADCIKRRFELVAWLTWGNSVN